MDVVELVVLRVEVGVVKGLTQTETHPAAEQAAAGGKEYGKSLTSSSSLAKIKTDPNVSACRSAYVQWRCLT